MLPYIHTLFDQLDCFLCAIFGGAPDTTISLAAAKAKRNRRLWGCWLCAWLHFSLRQHHCERTIKGEPLGAYALVCAGCQLALLFAAIFYLLPWAIGRVF